MKNLKIFKKLVIVMLSLALVAVCSGKVFAADDDLFTSVGTSNNTATSDNSATGNEAATNSGAESTNTSANSSLTTTNTANTAATNNTTRNTSTNNVATTNTASRNVTNTLAKTGLSNSGSVIALVVAVCGISAIYSYKKVNDYKKL